MILTIIIFLAVLVVIVLAHEMGHFFTARARKVSIVEFGLFFPPRLIGIKREAGRWKFVSFLNPPEKASQDENKVEKKAGHDSTLYSLNLIPLGGFVKMAGEEDPNIPGALASKGAGTRLLVLSSGALVNLLLPVVFFSIAAMYPHNMITQPVVIEEVVPGTPAAAAGFRPGDAILSVHGRTVENIPDMQRFTHLYLGDEINIVVKGSDGVNRTLMVVPRWNPPPGQGAMGIKLDINAAQAGQKTISESEPFWRAIPAGFRECIDAFVLFKNEVITWFSGTGAPQVVGPVGMAELTGEVARAGFSPLLQWAAFISINLGIVNLIPLPALDGGRIFFVLLEIVRRGKRVSPKTEGLIHLIGFVLLIGLMILVTYRDIFNIITGGSAIP